MGNISTTMSKADEQALKAYPVVLTDDYAKVDTNRFERQAYKEGYQQGQEDLKEEMKWDIIEGQFDLNSIDLSYSDLARKVPNKKHGDKVRIIIINN